MARDNQNHKQRIQRLEELASTQDNNSTNFTTKLIRNKYVLFGLSSLVIVTVSYLLYNRRIPVQKGLISLEQESINERILKMISNVRHKWQWSVFFGSMAVTFFVTSCVIQVSKHKDFFQKILTCANNYIAQYRPEKGYTFWLIKFFAILMAAVPLNWLIKYILCAALGYFILPTIYPYLFKPENSTRRNNSMDDSNSLQRPEIEIWISIENHLFWLERTAIICSMIFCSERILILTMSNAMFILFSVLGKHVVPSDPKLYYLFWIERVAIIFLLAYGFTEIFFIYYIALTFLVSFTPAYFGDHNNNDEYPEDIDFQQEFGCIRRVEKPVDLTSENISLKRENELLAEKYEKSKRQLKEKDDLMDKEREKQSRDFEMIHILLTNAETKCDDLVEKLDEASSKIRVLEEEKRGLTEAIMEDVESLEKCDDALEKEEKRFLESEAKYMRQTDSLLSCQGRVLELTKEIDFLREEYKQVEMRCEIYKSLLHDKDL